MVTVVLVLVGPPLALVLARRAASFPAVIFVGELLVSAFVLYRWLFRSVRSTVRFVAGEVRTWTPSR